MQFRFRHIARNVLSNWFATAANLAVGFFLAPFIVHRLGNIAYGVWVLAISSVNYLGLLDLGMRSSVLRFVSKGYTVGDHGAASEALSAALWVRLQISGLVLILSAGLAALFPVIFKIPGGITNDARLAVAIIGVTTTVSMSMGVFGGVLSALNRYDLQTGVTLCQLVIRVTGVVLVLRSGHGIVAIALCELLAGALANTLLVFVARRIYPQLRVFLKRPRRELLRSLWTYSLYAFLTTVAVQLVYQTDNLVVGTFISAAAVTFYSIGNSLCRYTDQFAGAMTLTFVPAASTYEASGDTARLRALYYYGTRATMALSLPILVTLIFRGHTFIALWMGRQYEQTSGTVLAILATALIFSLANTSGSAVAFAAEKHKQTAKWAIGEGTANLILSITLAKWIGIYGVAIGTLVPSLFVQLVLWPGYVSKLVGIGRFEVMFKIWGPVLVSAVPFAVGSFLVDRFYPAPNMAMFLMQTILLLPLFIGTAALIFRGSIAQHVIPRLRSYLSFSTS